MSDYRGTKRATAWAIKLNDRWALAGIFFWHMGPINPYHDGIRTAVFATRKQAREFCKTIHTHGGKRPCVIRVEVAITEVKP